MPIDTPEIWAVVPAAGSGTRMERDIPKQYLAIQGEAILALSVRKLLAIELIKGVVVALRADDERWQTLAVAQLPNVHTVVGGATRSESVLKALHFLSQRDDYAQQQTTTWVCVHDAARPCVRTASIRKLIQHCLEKNRGAILGVPIADTIKRIVPNNSSLYNDTLNNNTLNNSAEQDVGIEKTVNREQLWHAHTPQMFLLRELKAALDYCELDGMRVTDEASAIENVHGVADMVLDRRDNIKITVAEDLALAEFILQQQAKGE